VSQDVISKSKPPLFDALTGLRALGAWWIVLFHIRGELARFVPDESLIMRFADAGHVGITLFFVLSGFVISYNYASRFQSLEAKSYFQFLWQRLARIYPVHLMMLMVLACIFVTANMVDIRLNEPERYTLKGFIQHLLLINAWSVPLQITWNGVAWTLSLEWICYIVFPVLSVFTFRIKNPFILVYSTVALLGLTAVLRIAIGNPYLVARPRDFFEYFFTHFGALVRHPSLFMIGFLMYRAYIKDIGTGLNWRYINTIAFLGFIATAIAQTFFQGKNLFVLPFITLLIYGLTSGRGTVARLFQTKLMTYWGYTSYALFMTHPICLLLLRKFLPFKDFEGNNFFILPLLLLIYISVICFVARIVYVWIEEPARDWMRMKVKVFSQSG
jgi:peptidoglycan/LPS O-acetylase OafA/YrhL